MRGRLHHVVLDCADPDELAGFYSALLGLPVTYRSPDWVVVAENEHSSGLAFQPVAHYLPPVWPEGVPGQQLHLDVMVADPEAADAWVIDLGARRLPGGDHVYADPAGHPFCLVRKPDWAPGLDG
ncbi:MAG TPA: VOC family protein [Jatrophihabitans sp.]|nr:VOC family protein [Jatrophihabitans sp.]